MSNLKVYYDLMSQPARALIIFLRANNIPHTERLINLKKGENLTEEFKKVNPLQTVPCIEHNAFKLGESIAITRYLSREFKVSDHWYPSDSKKRAKVDQFLFWQVENLRRHGTEYFRTKLLHPARTNLPVDEFKLAHHASMLDKVLNVVETHYLRTDYVAGCDRISIADLFAVCELYQPWCCGLEIFSKHDKIRMWAERTKSMVLPHFDYAHSVIYKVRNNNVK